MNDLKKVIEEEENREDSMPSEEMHERLKESTGQTRPDAPMEDIPLFGEDDLIVNTMETELATVNSEIDKATTVIQNKQSLVRKLAERKANLTKSINVIRERHAGEEPTEQTEEGEEIREPDPDNLPEEVDLD